MRIACISDIHGNLPALEAVLADVRAQSPDLTLSLGDQVNFGPQPLQVLQLLESEGVPCLLGNHEQRVLALREASDAALNAINFASVRWTMQQLAGVDLNLPLNRRVGEVLFAHAGAENPSLRLDDLEAVRAELDALPYPLLVCGHYHNPLQHHAAGRALCVIGSVGMAENGVPGTALYALVDQTPQGVHVTPRIVPYDSGRLYEAFRSSGILDMCPIMSRVVHEAMTQNRCMVMEFLAHVHAVMASCGEDAIDERAWTLAGNTFAWRTGQTVSEYWGL